MESRIAGVILSGGKNTRMDGRNKAFLKIGGRAMIERILILFKIIFKEVILVTNLPLEEKYSRLLL